MTDKKISTLTTLSAADLLPYSDYVPIVDVSEAAAADRNKKIFTSSITGLRTQAKTAGYTLVAADHGTVINVTSNSVTITTDPAATLGSGWWCWVFNSASTSSHATTIDPNASETIDGKSTWVLRRGEGILIVCDGSNFQVAAARGIRGFAANISSTATRPVASGDASVAIGPSSTASGSNSLAIGNATASGSNSIAIDVAGSSASTASGSISMTLGRNNQNSGSNSLLVGSGGSNSLSGKMAFSSLVGSVNGDCQIGDQVLYQQTTTSTPAQMAFVGVPSATAIPALQNNSTWAFVILVVGRRADADGENAAYKFEGAIKRDGNAASTAIVGTVTKTVLAEDTAAWDCSVTADTTNGGINVTVTGENSKTIEWRARVSTVEVIA